MSITIMPLAKNNQKLRFGIVGAANTLIDFGIFSVLVLVGLPTVIANYPATTTALLFSYFANRRFTFRAAGQKQLRQIVLFFGVTLLGSWVIQPVILHLLEPPLLHVTGHDYISAMIAKVCATCATLIWNYLLYKRVVFRSQA